MHPWEDLWEVGWHKPLWTWDVWSLEWHYRSLSAFIETWKVAGNVVSSPSWQISRFFVQECFFFLVDTGNVDDFIKTKSCSVPVWRDLPHWVRCPTPQTLLLFTVPGLWSLRAGQGWGGQTHKLGSVCVAAHRREWSSTFFSYKLRGYVFWFKPK